MSASTERKNRQAAREAGTDKKQLALEKAAQEKAKSKRRWTIGTVAVVVVIALVLLLNSPLVYRSAAYTVGDRKYSTAEVSYRYANQYSYFANQYGSYASMFGLDTSAGIQGLDKQACPFTDGSWKDYFLDAAKNDMLQTKAMLDYAAQRLTEAGYAPYYLYRQKFMSGGFENVGWAKDGRINLYNIVIMEELRSILAMGGGGSTKLIRPDGGRNIRLMAPKYPLEYIEKIGETCADKIRISEFYRQFQEEGF